MKNTLLMMLALLFSLSCYAQTEPETLRGKDMMDKIDRSEIEAMQADTDVDIEADLPMPELEKIQFDKPNGKPPVNNPKPVTEPQPAIETKPVTEPQPAIQTKPVLKPSPAFKTKSSTKPEPKPVTKPVLKPSPAFKTKSSTKPEPKPVTKPESKPEPKPEAKPESENTSTQNQTEAKKRLLVSPRKVSINQLEVGDLVVVKDGITYIRRDAREDRVQYRYIGTMPFTSKGLTQIGEDKYAIIDLDTLKADVK